MSAESAAEMVQVVWLVEAALVEELVLFVETISAKQLMAKIV